MKLNKKEITLLKHLYHNHCYIKSTIVNNKYQPTIKSLKKKDLINEVISPLNIEETYNFFKLKITPKGMLKLLELIKSKHETDLEPLKIIYPELIDSPEKQELLKYLVLCH